MTCPCFDERPGSQQPKATKAPCEERHALAQARVENGSLPLRRRTLRQNDRLNPQETITLHTMPLLEATVREERGPLLPSEQGARLATALRITNLGKQPPAVSQAERDLVERGVLNRFIDHKHSALAQQCMAVA